MYQGKETYRSPRKNHWRKWIWNRVKERLPVPARDAIVIYMPGLEDLDREVALRKGFSYHNLIAVDRDKDIVKKHRKNGKVAICGDVLDVIASWGESQLINAVVLDFLGGLGDGVNDKIGDIWNSDYGVSVCEGFVLAANLLRGRETKSTTVKFQRKSPVRPYNSHPAHRGELLYQSLFGCGALCSDLKGSERVWTNDDSRILNERNWNELLKGFGLDGSPCFHSYRSDGSLLWYDTVVMSRTKRTKESIRKVEESSSFLSEMPDSFKEFLKQEKEKRFNDVSAKTRAAKAVRSRYVA